jgi:hypothetical protein
MSYKNVLLFIIIILSVQTIIAQSIDIHSEYSQHETIIVKISGLFVEPISHNDLTFFKGSTPVAIDFDTAKLQDEWWIYMISPDNPGNYSFQINNIKQKIGNDIIESTIQANFTVTEDIAEFNINPGFLTADNIAAITLTNFGFNSIDISTSSESLSENIFSVNPQASKTINIDIPENIQEGLIFLDISSSSLSYTMPLLILRQVAAEKVTSFYFDRTNIFISMPPHYNESLDVFLRNNGTEIIRNISLSVSDGFDKFAITSPRLVEDLYPEEEEKIIIILRSANSGLFNGSITAQSENIHYNLLISLNVSSDINESLITTDSGEQVPINRIKSCQELEGVICAEDEICRGNTEIIDGESCCLAYCEIEEKKQSTFKRTLGWILLGIVALVIGWFWFKSRR